MRSFATGLIGFDSDSASVVYASSSPFSPSGAPGLIPDPNNTLDLGNSTDAWKNLYVSSTSFLDTVQLANPLRFPFTYASTTSSTINKPCGVTYIGAAGQTSTINNTFATGDYFVQVTPQGNPGIAQPAYVSTSSNQFTINTVSVITNATPYAWCVVKVY